MRNDGIVARERAFKDFDLGFRSNPVTGDIALKKNEQAIKQSIVNIILTNRGERPFDPNYGSNITSQLFENFDPIIESIIDEQVRVPIANYEPRAKVLDVSVTGSGNSMSIAIQFKIISPSETVTSVNIPVERLR